VLEAPDWRQQINEKECRGASSEDKIRVRWKKHYFGKKTAVAKQNIFFCAGNNE